jgi:hypothetical protein
VSLKPAAVAAKKRPTADGSRDGASKNARRRTRSSPRSSSCAV